MLSFLNNDFSSLNQFISKQNPSNIFILCDENTHEYCLKIILENLETTSNIEILEIEAGEEMKNLTTTTELWSILSDFQADKKSLLINLGGGVITDLGGFLASTYKRGIPFINIPTSLMAMCDASIGGKTAIDFNHFKNLIGSFYLPEKIFIYANFLNTLDKNELKSGFAEMLKHGLISDANYWEEISNIKEISTDNIKPYIEKSIEIKQKIVSLDYQEKNIRKILNFGHTLGHAIEGILIERNKILSHGECVAIGMIMETYLSHLQDLIPTDTTNHIIEKILFFFPKIDLSFIKNQEIFERMMNDKKNSHSNIYFSLIKNIGEGCFNIICDKKNIETSIEFYHSL